MDRSIFRALIWGSIVAVLLVAAPMTSTFAEGEDLEGGGIQWVDGWEAGKAEAAKAGKLIFLYFGRHTPT